MLNLKNILYLKYSSCWESNALVHSVAKNCCLLGTVLDTKDAHALKKNKGTIVMELRYHLREKTGKINKQTSNIISKSNKFYDKNKMRWCHSKWRG